MTDKVPGVTAVAPVERRQVPRRQRDRRLGARALVVADPAGEAEPKAPAPAPTGETDIAAVAFAAQVLGQSGQKKGLRGGAPVLDAARTSYLGAEYSGAGERRPRPGGRTDTDI